MKLAIGLDSLVSVLLVCLVLAAPCTGAGGGKSQPEGLSELEAVAVAEKLAPEVLPGSKPFLEGVSPERLAFFLVGGAGGTGPKPRLYFQGSRVGSFSDPEVVVGQGGEYTIPQLVVALAHLDKTREVARCGYAVLEPVAVENDLFFRGLKRFALGGVEDSFLCGVIRGIQDRRGGIGKEAGDGIHELLVESYVVDRRGDAEKPPVLKVTNLVDLGGAEPRLLEEVSSEEVEKLPADLPVHLEYWGAGKLRIVASYPAEEEWIVLPPELAVIREKMPALVVKSLVRDGDRTTIEATLPTQYEVATFIRELERQGKWQIVPENVVDEKQHFLFRVFYSPRPPEQPAKP